MDKYLGIGASVVRSILLTATVSALLFSSSLAQDGSVVWTYDAGG